jgi:hypothetical protein
MLMGLGFRRTWVEVAFLGSTGAAAVHFAAAQPHVEEWAPAGAFMLLSGLAQLAWALWIAVRPTSQAAAAGVALNSGIITLWLLSRTVGIPFGPNAGMAEHIHAGDALATTLEIVVVAATLAISSEGAPSRFLAKLVGAAAAVAVLVGAHDRLREGLTAAAALVITAVARSLAGILEVRRDHVFASIVRFVRAAGRAVGRAGYGARHNGPHPHRHLEQPGV